MPTKYNGVKWVKCPLNTMKASGASAHETQ